MTETEEKSRSDRRVRRAVDAVRARAAQVIWLACAACAILLASGALLVALEGNRGNDLVRWVLDAADLVDLGVFDVDDGVKQFDGKDADVKNALVNWGLGAVAWLVIGKIADRIVRP